MDKKETTKVVQIGDEKKEVKLSNLEYIPDFIKEAPWYMQDHNDKEKMDHQRQEEKKGPAFDQWYQRGLRPEQQKRKALIKFRKGACSNCGAVTHTAKECVERPRKLGAKYSETVRSKARDEYDTQ